MNMSIVRHNAVKFIYSEKATKLCEIFTLLLSYVVPVKIEVKISQNYLAFSEYMNFIKGWNKFQKCNFHANLFSREFL